MQQCMIAGAAHLLLQHLFLTSAALPAAGLLRSPGRGRGGGMLVQSGRYPAWVKAGAPEVGLQQPRAERLRASLQHTQEGSK